MKDLRLLPPAEAVAQTLHQVLVNEHRGALHEMADLLEQPYTTLYSQVTGQARTLPWDTIRAAHFVTLSKRLERFLVWPGLAVVRMPAASLPGKCLAGEIADVSDAAGALRQKVLEYARDGRFDRNELYELDEAMARLEAELGEVRAILDRLRVQSS